MGGCTLEPVRGSLYVGVCTWESVHGRLYMGGCTWEDVLEKSALRIRAHALTDSGFVVVL